MPFARPTLQQIAARVKLDVQGSLEGLAAFFRRSFERGVTNAMSGVSHQLHAHLEWLARQLDPTKCDEDILETVHCAPAGVFRIDAVKTRLRLLAPGTNGTVVTAGTVWQRADNTRYTAEANATVTGGNATVDVIAEIAGALANSDNATPMQIGSPIVGMAGTATVTSTLRVGSDRETPAALLDRYLQRRRNPPKGGSPGNFEGWVREVAGLTRVWEYPRLEGAGTVTVFAVNDEDDPITLPGPKLTEIATYLDQPGRQPTTMDAYVRTPTLQAIPMTIAVSPNTAEVRAAIEAEVDELYVRVGTPKGMTVLRSQVNEAISIAPNEVDHVMTVPAGDVVVPIGSLPVRGAITWSTL